MNILFVCPGFCENCQEKNCPVRGKLDEGLKNEMSKLPDGPAQIKMYEMMKKISSPENIAAVIHSDLQSLILNLKTNLNAGIVLDESQIENKIIKIIDKRVDIYRDDCKLDARDQSIKKFKYSVHQLALKINEYMTGRCNELFCGTCCINIMCDKIVKINNVTGNA